jgi:hypothetical protein
MALALVVALVVPMVALAAESDTTEITGTVAVAIEVSAPSSAALGSMEVSETNELVGGPITVTVNCTQTGWTLGASESGGNGFMSSAVSTDLLNPLQIKGGDIAAYTALSGTDVLLEETGADAAGETEIEDVNFNQKVVYADTAGAYSIIITFTGTAT